MKFFSIIISIALVFVFNVNGQDKNIEVRNNSFENPSLSNWAANNNYFYIDNLNVREGKSSLRIEHKDYSSTVVTSDEVNLKLGKLYKLSAYIKTENAITDDNKQYPTPLAACLSMQSFPFTNHSEAVGSTSDWKKIEIVFIATEKKDKICLNFGYNGDAKGTVWFDDVTLQEVDDITEYIPKETIRWYGDAFRFENKGWIFLHIEGEPYQRGVQYGYLAADEIKELINKLAYKKNNVNSSTGWNDIRFSADALFLRKYDEEYLTEMKGIADGVNKAGINIFGRNLELLDIVALNSSIDIDYSSDALHTTSNPLTGKSFLSQEDELTLQDKLHKCSSFLATHSATKDNRVVFAQVFMWNGYTGPHWNFIVDIKPSKGNHFVYETYPGGIHSGADFYINDKGLMVGETTTGQTPFNPEGTPQSNRIRKAVQYANNIDEFVKIMTDKNNGLYTNDWLIADTKTDEIAILLLGTNKYKLWRSSKNDFFGDQKDWYFSDNNNKSLDVRKEYVVNDYNAPYDLIFKPVNRDLSFTEFYDENKGKIDANAGINLLNSSPVNRPHACDGKVTTSEMAEQMMFFANYGKVTQREMFVNENGRIPDMPGAVPKFSLGYNVINPILFVEKIKQLKEVAAVKNKVVVLKNNFDEIRNNLSFNKEQLWHNSVYPANDKVNWFISGTAAYWNLLNSMPEGDSKSFNYIHDELSELNVRYLYTESREGSLKPVDTKQIYTAYKNYQLPRIKGTFALHQLHLFLGNKPFSDAMNEIHNKFKEKDIQNNNIIDIFAETTGKNVKDIIDQWINRDDLPSPTVSCKANNNNGWSLNLNVKQPENFYHFLTTIQIETANEKIYRVIEVKSQNEDINISLNEKPVKVIFNSLNDIPLKNSNFYTYSNLTDDFSKAIIVYGTSNQVEANHTQALRFQKTLADRFTEILLPVKKDFEIDEKTLKENDIILLGSGFENCLAKKILSMLKIYNAKNSFEWQGIKYGEADDGIYLTYPNPYNPAKTLYIFVANSQMQLYNMTKALNRMPQWALYKKDQIADKGYFINPDNIIEVK